MDDDDLDFIQDHEPPQDLDRAHPMLCGSTAPAATQAHGLAEGRQSQLIHEADTAECQRQSTEVGDCDGVDAGDESGSIVYDTSNEELRMSYILNILHKPRQNLVSRAPPCRPVAGSVYVFGPEVDKSSRRADQYSWYVDGAKLIPRSTKLMKKHYNYVRLASGGRSTEFRKYEYELPCSSGAQCNCVVVHYLGDESVAEEPVCHGNARKRTAPYVRSAGTVKKSIVAAGIDKSPMKVYRKLVTSDGGGNGAEAVAKPRNLEQVRNVQKDHRRQFRIGHDGLFNCIEIASQFPEFVHFIQVHPTLVIHLANKTLLKELDKAAKLSVKSDRSLVELNYDTTFTLGDFYVSVLSFRHPVFRGNPVIPVAIMVHERKYKRDHLKFMEFIADTCPALSRPGVAMVTDCEFDFSALLPSAVIAHCWNHLRRDVHFWLKKRCASADDFKVYADNVRQLLTAVSADAFHATYASVSVKWSAAFKDYFDKSLKNNVEHHSGRWILEPHGLYNEYSGITTNASESLNRVLKDLASWKERPADALIISFKYLLGYYQWELERGLHGLGNYNVKQEWRQLQQPPDLLSTQICPKLPEDIVEYVKSGLSGAEAPSNGTSGQIYNNPGQASSVSQEALAKDAIANGKVVFVSALKSFQVEGKNGHKYAVTVFPSEKCQCSSTGTCYHIVAAKLLMGMPLAPQRKVRNLSQLRKTTSKRTQKKSGRKAPRKDDYEVVPAEDSIVSQQDQVHQAKSTDTAKGACEDSDNQTHVPQLPNILVGSEVADRDSEAITRALGSKSAFQLNTVTILEPELDNPIRNSTAGQACVVSLHGGTAILVNRTLNPAKPVIEVYAFSAELATDDLMKYHAACFATPNVFAKKVKLIVKQVESSEDIGELLYQALSRCLTTKPVGVAEYAIDLGCICRKPFIGSMQMEDTLVCCADDRSPVCFIKYHESCLPRLLDLSDDEWICPQCLAPANLPTWGSTATTNALNTCSFDNMLVAVHVHNLEVGNSFFNLFDDSSSSAAFKHVLLLMESGSCDRAKDTWMHFLVQKCQIPVSVQRQEKLLDFFGTEFDMFIQFFSSSWLIQEESLCDSQGCPQRYQHKSRNLLAVATKDDVTNFQGSFVEARNRRCSERFRDVPLEGTPHYTDSVVDENTGSGAMAYYCSAQIVFKPVIFQTPSHIWLIPLYCGGSANLADMMQLPEEICIANIPLMLRAITLHSHDAEHFSAIVRWRKCWFYYDGCRQNRFTWFFMDTPGFENLKPNYVLYLRKSLSGV